MRAAMLVTHPGVRFHSGEELRRAPALSNGRRYKVIVPKCYLVWVIIFMLLSIGETFVFMYFTGVFANTPSYYAQNSWCVVRPLQVDGTMFNNYYAENPCIDPDLWWHSADTTPSDFHDGEECTANSDYGYAFCNSDPTITEDWCEEIFDTVVYESGIECGDLSLTFFKPSNYSSNEYLLQEDNAWELASWYWIYPAIFDAWLILILWSLFVFPCSIRRDTANSFEVRNCCGTRLIPLAGIHQVIVFDKYDWCAHRYILRGIRYLSCSNWAGVQANGYPTIVLVTNDCSSYSYRISMSEEDYQDFLRDNTLVAGASEASAATYGTVALLEEEGNASVTIPVAQRATVTSRDPSMSSEFQKL